MIDELLVRAQELRQAATEESRAADSIRQWATDLEIEVHTLIIRSWMPR